MSPTEQKSAVKVVSLGLLGVCPCCGRIVSARNPLVLELFGSFFNFLESMVVSKKIVCQNPECRSALTVEDFGFDSSTGERVRWLNADGTMGQKPRINFHLIDIAGGDKIEVDVSR